MDAERAMDAALREASRRPGSTHPNPSVGAVVYRRSGILGVGATRPTGGAHAEIVALRNAMRKHGAKALRGAFLATTLEPCHHQGRTGPCTQAILEAGIRRVAVGQRDPNPAVAGRGLRALRRTGVEVLTGLREAECRWHHRGFLAVQAWDRPWVALKLAATLDGRIATRSGESRWITGEAARAHVHQLRNQADAVMVGSATAKLDDPRLNVRRGARGGRNVEKKVRCPIRILVDSKLVVPPSRSLFQDEDADRTWVLTSSKVSAARRRAREGKGARLLEVAQAGGHLNLARAMQRLAWEGLTQILVEGGGGLAAALLRAQLVDELHWYSAPSLLGSDGSPAVGPLSVQVLASRPEAEVREVRRLGRDLYVHGVLSPVPTSASAARTRRMKRTGASS